MATLGVPMPDTSPLLMVLTLESSTTATLGVPMPDTSPLLMVLTLESSTTATLGVLREAVMLLHLDVFVLLASGLSRKEMLKCAALTLCQRGIAAADVPLGACRGSKTVKYVPLS
jgi:hypothetical protein